MDKKDDWERERNMKECPLRKPLGLFYPTDYHLIGGRPFFGNEDTFGRPSTKYALQNLIRYKPTFVERFLMLFSYTLNRTKIFMVPFLLHENVSGKTFMASFIDRRSIDKNKYPSTKNIIKEIELSLI